jgi:aconitate hydratase
MEFGKSNSFGSLSTLTTATKEYKYFNLKKAAAQIGFDLSRLPNSMKVIFENLLRFENGLSVRKLDIEAVGKWLVDKKSEQEIAYHPARVLMQDFTGVPAVVDLAAMRDATKNLGGDPKKINPLIPVDLVIDHSVQVDKYGTTSSFTENVKLEMSRNRERYEFLKWGQGAFDNFRVVPPGTGICHQVNLEYLAQVVWTKTTEGDTFAFPDTLVGTDSHTTMINGLSVLGWGVGGIEAEAAMLGQPISMLIPEVVGFKLTGKLKEGTTATDLVLTVTQMLRKKGVVNKFVEFYGPGLKGLPLADRATIANMAPEYGATCGFFPVDEETIKYLKLSGRPDELVELVEAYSKEQGLWRDDNSDFIFTDTLALDLSTVEPSLAGPKRPQDKVLLAEMTTNFAKELPSLNKTPENEGKEFAVHGKNFKIKNGDVVIAAITSCTNTSNPYVMISAGLLARNAAKRGLTAKPWVKTSLAPGSQVVSEYLEKSGLQVDLDKLGFNIVGFGCTTCIGNSGPLNEEIEKTIVDNNLVVASVLSGNRNFEGRVHPMVRANYLASPPLCVAYAIAGSIELNLLTQPLGKDRDGNDVYLKDIWPSNEEVAQVVSNTVTSKMFKEKYSNVFAGNDEWKSMIAPKGMNYSWDSASSYIKRPPYFDGMKIAPEGFPPVKDAKLLAIFGDSITTDHISPAGSISKNTPAAKYLNDLHIDKQDFNSYGARRGNHEVMMRGTFANVRIKNEMLDGVEGGSTKIHGKGEVVSIYDAAMAYEHEGVSAAIVAGKEYGTGSSRDWAAKGPNLLGVKMVLAESFERIHRSNLVGMGILPLQFVNGMTRADLRLDGSESFDLNLGDKITPLMHAKCKIHRGSTLYKEIEVLVRIDTEMEVEYIKNGGILHYVLRNLV